jgi:hypothetical protein
VTGDRLRRRSRQVDLEDAQPLDRPVAGAARRTPDREPRRQHEIARSAPVQPVAEVGTKLRERHPLPETILEDQLDDIVIREVQLDRRVGRGPERLDTHTVRDDRLHEASRTCIGGDPDVFPSARYLQLRHRRMFPRLEERGVTEPCA